jgi:hypothetical protein
MRHLTMAEAMIRSMITEYLGFDKKRAQDTRTVKHSTPQERKRMTITKAIREVLRRQMIREATASNRKAIPTEQEWADQVETFEDYDCDVARCRGLRRKLQHFFTSEEACMAEWKDIQCDSTHEGKNYRNRLWNKMRLPSKTPTVLFRLLNRTLEDHLGEGSYWSAAVDS